MTTPRGCREVLTMGEKNETKPLAMIDGRHKLHTVRDDIVQFIEEFFLAGESKMPVRSGVQKQAFLTLVKERVENAIESRGGMLEDYAPDGIAQFAQDMALFMSTCDNIREQFIDQRMSIVSVLRQHVRAALDEQNDYVGRALDVTGEDDAARRRRVEAWQSFQYVCARMGVLAMLMSEYADKRIETANAKGDAATGGSKS